MLVVSHTYYTVRGQDQQKRTRRKQTPAEADAKKVKNAKEKHAKDAAGMEALFRRRRTRSDSADGGSSQVAAELSTYHAASVTATT